MDRIKMERLLSSFESMDFWQQAEQLAKLEQYENKERMEKLNKAYDVLEQSLSMMMELYGWESEKTGMIQSVFDRVQDEMEELEKNISE